MRPPPSRKPSLVAAAAVLASATALAGCSAAKSTSGSSSGGAAALTQSKNAHATGALTVWIRGAGDSPKAYQKIFDAFTAQTGIQVKIGLSTLTDFETKLTAAATAHQLPDIAVDDAAQLGNFAGQGIILPVDKDPYTGALTLTDQAWKSASDIKGQAYAVPFSAQANVLLVRKDWLDKLGLQAPKTWDDVEAVAKAFTTQDPDGNGKKDTYGLAVPGTTARGYTSWYASSFLYEAGGDWLKSTGGGKFTAAVNTPEATKAVQYLENQICTDKVVQPSVLGDDTTATNKAFQTGVAMLIPIMSITAFFRGFRSHFVDHAFHLAGRPHLMLWFLAPAAVANVLLNLVLVPRYGMMGAAWSALVCQAGATVASWFIGRRVFPLWLPPGSVVRVVAAVLAMAVVLWIVRFPLTWLGLIGAVTLGLAVFGLASVLLDVGGIRSRRPALV